MFVVVPGRAHRRAIAVARNLHSDDIVYEAPSQKLSIPDTDTVVGD